MAQLSGRASPGSRKYLCLGGNGSRGGKALSTPTRPSARHRILSSAYIVNLPIARPDLK